MVVVPSLLVAVVAVVPLLGVEEEEDEEEEGPTPDWEWKDMRGGDGPSIRSCAVLVAVSMV